MLPSWLPPPYTAELSDAANQPVHPRHNNSKSSNLWLGGFENGRHPSRSRWVGSLEDLHFLLLILSIILILLVPGTPGMGSPDSQQNKSCVHRGWGVRHQVELLRWLILKTHGIPLPLGQVQPCHFGFHCNVPLTQWFLQRIHCSHLLESYSFSVYLLSTYNVPGTGHAAMN